MVVVRQARLADVRAIGRIEVETWRTTYAGMVPDRVLLRMSEQRQTASWAGFLRHRPGDVFVAEREVDDEVSILAFGNCGPQREQALGFGGEVYTLYVQPEAQGAGLGRQLLLALFARLVHCGHRSALVWVVRANPARFFYERLGGKLVLHRSIPVGGEPIASVAYGWRDLRALLDREAKSRASPP
ncbi:MAG TPA: N-acetyltransferase [Stellaceae bacterium]|nr:N-acetyltransferase [Stellaceae bacterium]